MKNEFKSVTPEELLAWVKRSRHRQFTYTNINCGCLMTRHFVETYHVKDASVWAGGAVYQITLGWPLFLGLFYPFHNEFWNKFLQAGAMKNGITKEQAVARLEEMIS